MKFFFVFVDRFLSIETPKDNVIDYYRSKIAVFYLLSQLPLCFGFGFIFHYMIPLGGMEIIAPLGGVVFIISLLVGKRLENPWISAQVGPGMTLFSIGYAVYETGGIASPAMGALLLIPLVAGMVGGQKTLLFWSILTLLTLLGFFESNQLGIEIPNQVAPEFYSLFSILTVCSLVTLVSISFTLKGWIEEIARKKLIQANFILENKIKQAGSLGHQQEISAQESEP